MMKPNPIDQDASGKRIFGTGDRLFLFVPTTTFLKWLAVWVSEDLRKLPGHFRPAIISVAADKNLDVIRSGLIYERHGSRWGAGMGGGEFINLALQLPQFLAGRN